MHAHAIRYVVCTHTTLRVAMAMCSAMAWRVAPYSMCYNASSSPSSVFCVWLFWIKHAYTVCVTSSAVPAAITHSDSGSFFLLLHFIFFSYFARSWLHFHHIFFFMIWCSLVPFRTNYYRIDGSLFELKRNHYGFLRLFCMSACAKCAQMFKHFVCYLNRIRFW